MTALISLCISLHTKQSSANSIRMKTTVLSTPCFFFFFFFLLPSLQHIEYTPIMKRQGLHRYQNSSDVLLWLFSEAWSRWPSLARQLSYCPQLQRPALISHNMCTLSTAESPLLSYPCSAARAFLLFPLPFKLAASLFPSILVHLYSQIFSCQLKKKIRKKKENIHTTTKKSSVWMIKR